MLQFEIWCHRTTLLACLLYIRRKQLLDLRCEFHRDCDVDDFDVHAHMISFDRSTVNIFVCDFASQIAHHTSPSGLADNPPTTRVGGWQALEGFSWFRRRACCSKSHP